MIKQDRVAFSDANALREECLKRGTRQKRQKERENKSQVQSCF